MAQTGARSDPYVGLRFRVEVDGLEVGGFSEVRGLDVRIDVQSYREGGENQFEHKLIGPASYPSDLSLRRGLADIDVFWDWIEQVGRGVIVRRNLSISLLGLDGEPAKVWDCLRAVPVHWSGPRLDAQQGSVGFESIDLVHHGLVRARNRSLISLVGRSAQTAQRWV